MVYGARGVLGDILPSWVSMLAFSPLLWSVPEVATVGIHRSSPLIYGVASPGTELAATWEQWEPAAELRLGCPSLGNGPFSSNKMCSGRGFFKALSTA